MSLSGNISRPTLLAAWRSPTRPISRPRSVHPCVSCRTTRKKSDLSTKNHRSNMLREGELTYGLINNNVFVSFKRTGARTSPIVDSINGRIPPLTPEAQKIADAEREFRLALLQSTET